MNLVAWFQLEPNNNLLPFLRRKSESNIESDIKWSNCYNNAGEHLLDICLVSAIHE